jgi:hypothetical protein
MARFQAVWLAAALLACFTIAQVSYRPGNGASLPVTTARACRRTAPQPPPPSQAQDTSAVTPRGTIQSTAYATAIGEARSHRL